MTANTEPFIQKLFTSRDNEAAGTSYVGEPDRIWWDPIRNAFFYSDGITPGGIIINGSVSFINQIEGGSADSIYLTTDQISGGAAASTYLPSQIIDGGNALTP